MTAVTMARLVELERVIERGQQTFVEVGMALLEIRDSRLYRASHGTFEDYCRERWGWTHRHANRVIEASEVAGLVGPTGPSVEAQARELAPLRDQPDAMREVWASVVARAEATDEPVTAPLIRNGVRDYIRGMAAESEAELQRATADWSDAQRADYQPEMFRQRGELTRLVGDIASLPEPRSFLAAHRRFLRRENVERAEQAHRWLGAFLEEWRSSHGD
jgi:hypothetical protein